MPDADVPTVDVADKQTRGQPGESGRSLGRIFEPFGARGPGDQDDAAGTPLQALQTHGRWKSPQMPARYTRSEKALEALEWLV